ncbi:MAG: 2-amino-4-hydroxy-6-hydroxymethyldihydropteridine pyrophosphokinase [Alphaproteobacteria bacterium MarineAlpha6_Bin4]|nr:MAG: 2-amino-4-hydroxy-6-hydroxymethyldihydropteridine pyrophosphokinase [Alphaproteobacteria bacterium MarineAlpha6_Bin3]PPR37128.1 MAG: 2-amino-4-hydroxy-6-hydroxymethyldihydropteridine pyrophosphokinase [Alphaproteobacteria bacterium MarineAlpha6_Bin4]
MIYIGIGSNLSGNKNQKPIENCKEAIFALKKQVTVCKISSWYKSEPVPVSNQPWFINGVVEINTDKTPIELLEYLLKIEEVFGRLRQKKNEARIIDLDIIDYKKKVIYKENKLITPHPRMHERPFVLLPLKEISPKWKHPIKKVSLDKLLNKLNYKKKILKI